MPSKSVTLLLPRGIHSRLAVVAPCEPSPASVCVFVCARVCALQSHNLLPADHTKHSPPKQADPALQTPNATPVAPSCKSNRKRSCSSGSRQRRRMQPYTQWRMRPLHNGVCNHIHNGSRQRRRTQQYTRGRLVHSYHTVAVAETMVQTEMRQ
jgi:hypothetical protein